MRHTLLTALPFLALAACSTPDTPAKQVPAAAPMSPAADWDSPAPVPSSDPYDLPDSMTPRTHLERQLLGMERPRAAPPVDAAGQNLSSREDSAQAEAWLAEQIALARAALLRQTAGLTSAERALHERALDPSVQLPPEELGPDEQARLAEEPYRWLRYQKSKQQLDRESRRAWARANRPRSTTKPSAPSKPAPSSASRLARFRAVRQR